MEKGMMKEFMTLKTNNQKQITYENRNARITRMGKK